MLERFFVGTNLKVSSRSVSRIWRCTLKFHFFPSFSTKNTCICNYDDVIKSPDCVAVRYSESGRNRLSSCERLDHFTIEMSTTPEPDHNNSTSSREALFVAAAAARAAQLQDASSKKTAKQLAKEHEVKQAFRRLIDPGIMRPNSRESAIEALKVSLSRSSQVLSGNEQIPSRLFTYYPTTTFESLGTPSSRRSSQRMA